MYSVYAFTTLVTVKMNRCFKKQQSLTFSRWVTMHKVIFAHIHAINQYYQSYHHAASLSVSRISTTLSWKASELRTLQSSLKTLTLLQHSQTTHCNYWPYSTHRHPDRQTQCRTQKIQMEGVNTLPSTHRPISYNLHTVPPIHIISNHEATAKFITAQYGRMAETLVNAFV